MIWLKCAAVVIVSTMDRVIASGDRNVILILRFMLHPSLMVLATRKTFAQRLISVRMLAEDCARQRKYLIHVLRELVVTLIERWFGPVCGKVEAVSGTRSAAVENVTRMAFVYQLRPEYAVSQVFVRSI